LIKRRLRRRAERVLAALRAAALFTRVLSALAREAAVLVRRHQIPELTAALVAQLAAVGLDYRWDAVFVFSQGSSAGLMPSA
jgi:hypothetical protein